MPHSVDSTGIKKEQHSLQIISINADCLNDLD